MKLSKFINQKGYIFILFFENGECKEIDLQGLIEKYVSPEEIKTAQINPQWGYLEFDQGKVDIEPKTLYKFACNINGENEVKAA